MSNAKAVKAYKLWRETFNYDKTFLTMERFAAFLGDPYNPYSKRNYIINWENPEVMKKIELILGPNGHTLLKMWKIQQGEEP